MSFSGAPCWSRERSPPVTGGVPDCPWRPVLVLHSTLALGTCYYALNKNREPAKAQNFVSALLKVLLGLVVGCPPPGRHRSVQHGVQLVGEVIKHVADVVQDGPC